MIHSVLIIDHDPARRQATEQLVRELGYSTSVSGRLDDMSAGREFWRRHGVSLILLSLIDNPDNGIALIERLHESPGAPAVIVQVQHDRAELASRALSAGAVDFLTVPTNPERLRVVLRNAARIHALEGELSRVKPQMQALVSIDDMIGKSEEMQRAIGLARRAARFHMPVLLEGEPGVGKALMARAIHNASDHADRPYCAVDCTALTSENAVDVLFARDTGSYWKAAGGSLFLDEIGSLPPEAQAELVSLLEQAAYAIQCGHKRREPKVNILASNSRDMIALVKAGHFREDLYYRLNVFPIWMPPLRERTEDIPDLAEHFLARFAAEEHKHIEGIDEDAIRLLQGYEWPGNVRQLENAMFRAVVLASGHRLTVDEFPQIAAQTGDQSADLPTAERQRYDGPAIIGSGTAAARLSPTGDAARATVVGIPALTDRGDVRSLDDVEADLIRLALGRYRGRMTEVAKRLGIGRSTLYRKMREFGLEMRPGARH